MEFFLGTQEQVRSSCDKLAISVRANEVLLYFSIPGLLISNQVIECLCLISHHCNSTVINFLIIYIISSLQECSVPIPSLTLLHPERPKLYAILAFLSAIGLIYVLFSCIDDEFPGLYMVAPPKYCWCLDNKRIVLNTVWRSSQV